MVLPIMFALISANIVNAIGDWALIYGHLGLPAMGITGSGWATCVARIYMAGVLVVTLLGDGSKRFNELRRGLGSISQRMLTLTLRGLVWDGLVTRTVFPTMAAIRSIPEKA